MPLFDVDEAPLNLCAGACACVCVYVCAHACTHAQAHMHAHVHMCLWAMFQAFLIQTRVTWEKATSIER